MTQSLINLGTGPNTGTGEPLRDGGVKIQANFTELYSRVGLLAVAASTYVNGGLSIDRTGATDSFLALQDAINVTAAAGTWLNIDCPIKVTIGTDYTRGLFIPSNAKIAFNGTGKIITDSVMVPLMVIANSTDVTFYDLTIQYTGTFGVTAIDQQNPFTSAGTLTNFNDVTFKAYLGTSWGNTYSGSGSAIFPSATNACALICVSGQANRVNFLGKTTAYVPDGAAASSFIPVFMSGYANWLPNTLVTSAMQVAGPTASTAACPDHVFIEELWLDGYYMGIVGTFTHIRVDSCHATRYSDLQDASGNNVGGQVYNAITLGSTPVTGNTTLTLSGNWTAPSKSYVVTFSDGTTRTVPFVNGSSTTGTFTALPSGTFSSTVQVSYSNNWFAPPHLFYVHSLDFAFNFPATQMLGPVFDEGVYVGTPNRRNTGSGYLNSIKAEPANGSRIIDYTSLRPDGGIDILGFGNSNGAIKIYVQFDSSTAQKGQLVFTGSLTAATSATLTAPWQYGAGSQTYTATFSDLSVRTVTVINGQTSVTWTGAVTASAIASVVNTSNIANFAFRFPSTPPIVTFSLDIDYFDTATVPAGAPCQGDGQPGNTGVNIRARGVINDVPFGSTWNPGFKFGGNNIKIEHTLIMKSCSTTQTFIGCFPNASTLLTESQVVINVIGWRAAAVTFTANLSAATSGTITTWNYGNGTFNIAFSTGDIRAVSVTGTAATWSGAVTTGDALGTVLLLDDTNIDNYVNRAQVFDKGLSYGTNVTINDVTNGIIQTFENGVQKQRWSRTWVGSPTGTSTTTGIIFPTTFAIVGFAFNPTVTITGPASINIGWSGGTQLVNAGGVSTATNPWTNPTTYPIAVASQTGITIAAGSSITAGSVVMSAVAERFNMPG